jgi:hypothetical protein
LELPLQAFFNESDTALQDAVREAPKSRYFVELHVPEKPGATRILMDEIRRHKALEFMQVLNEWLDDHGMRADVRSLTTTAMGQVMIVCTHRVMDLIRAQDIWAIAHIRCSDQVTDLKRVSKRV